MGIMSLVMARRPIPPPSPHAGFDAQLADGIRRMGLEPTAAHVRQFFCYMDLLQQWSAKINLTAIVDPLAIIDRHFCDSLALWPALGLTTPSAFSSRSRLLDVGSGAGFPGVPLKIMAPEIGLTLLEPRQKRAAFLQVLIAELGCTHSQVATSRLTEHSCTEAEGYNWIVARGVGQFDDLIAEAIHLLAPDGSFTFYLTERQARSRITLKPRDGFEMSQYPYRLPISGLERRLLLLKRRR
jgi:16S rRNA (guanine527-N7)-methyltransferase